MRFANPGASLIFQDRTAKLAPQKGSNPMNLREKARGMAPKILAERIDRFWDFLFPARFKMGQRVKIKKDDRVGIVQRRFQACWGEWLYWVEMDHHHIGDFLRSAVIKRESELRPYPPWWRIDLKLRRWIKALRKPFC